ncbi:MAG: PhoU domain-containing protein, partial [Melioribacteraceae bacterium]|nr:PhoU domain-containing protein [Melioribacteraceae bacterium]
RAYDRSFKMLDLTHEKFLNAKEVLREKDELLTSININDQDIEVNKYQREVRRDVFTHLTMAGTDELASGLALVSIVIDIERIGDYTKNIVEIASQHKAELRAGYFEDDLKKIEDAVCENFKRTINCFKNSDAAEAEKLISEYKWVSKLSDKIIEQLITDDEYTLNARSAVALTLYIRSLKRVYSHLRNVTTSIINPFDRIGYKPKKKQL